MKKSKVIRVVIILVVLLANVGCDQVSKIIVREQVAYREQIPIIENYFTLTNVENKGAFLSTGNDWPEPIRLAVLMILPVLVLLWAFYYLFTKSGLTNLRVIGISLMVSGGIGNIYDRIVYNSVTDFLYMDFVIFHTGVFNLADVSIMTGMLLSIYDSMMTSRKMRNVQGL